MELTKHAHACVRLTGDDGVLVIDPGDWVEPVAVTDASAVLLTHEHFDHVNLELVKQAADANPKLQIFTVPAVVSMLSAKGIAATEVASGDSFHTAGFDVAVVGGEHAEIWCGKPGCANVGFIVDGSVYHPGDAFWVPGEPIETLLVPVSGPWLKTGEVIDFLAAVKPTRSIPIHDGLLSDRGQQVTDRWVQSSVAVDYVRLADGESVKV